MCFDIPGFVEVDRVSGNSLGWGEFLGTAVNKILTVLHHLKTITNRRHCPKAMTLSMHSNTCHSSPLSARHLIDFYLPCCQKSQEVISLVASVCLRLSQLGGSSHFFLIAFLLQFYNRWMQLGNTNKTKKKIMKIGQELTE